MQKSVAIVVTYNRKEMLEKNLRALLVQDSPSFDVLVCDNAGTDGTYELVRSYAESFRTRGQMLRYRNPGQNLGGAGGFSYAIKKAVHLGYDKVWLMDDDTCPKPDAYVKLLEADRLLSGNYAYLASQVLWTDDTPCRMNLTIERNIEHDQIQKTIQPIRQASFVSLLIPTQKIIEVGLPIRQFFLYGDDVEYTGRLNKVGIGYLVSESKVVHLLDENKAADPVTLPEQKRNRIFYDSRNRFYIARQNGLRGLASYFYHQGQYAYRMLTEAGDDCWKRLCILLKGTLAGFVFVPKVEFVKRKS